MPAEPRHAPPAVPRGAAEPASTPSTQGQPAVKPTEPAPPVEPAAQAPTAAEPERGGGGTATPGAAPGASDGAEGMRTGRVPDPRGKPRALKLMQARLRAHQRARGAEPTEQAPAEAKDVPAPPQEPPRLKAGKPRSQDF